MENGKIALLHKLLFFQFWGEQQQKNVSLHIIIYFFIVSFEKSSQKLVLPVSSGVANTLKQ